MIPALGGRALGVLAAGVWLATATARGEGALTTVRAMFMGDQGMHRPSERFQQLQPVLQRRGIELVYTERLDDLNPGRLAGFDAVVIYANVTAIEPRQERALLEFVAAGGGLVPIHCASYCFHNSAAYIELVGAQFKSHGAGVFRETIVRPEHPVMQGLEAIESWDETYVHTRHNTNRVVLAERREGGQAEPWTWVREQGRGRVFYTAWGHDHRTWGNAGFHALIERGIRWAAANSPTALKPRERLPVLETVVSPHPMPNYLAGAKWGTEGAQITTMQKPLSPADSARHLVTLPGFQSSLFAAEPDIVKPIWMAWDERGRLWIAETVDYPNERPATGKGRDRIQIVEDTDGDGRADRFTVFADGLSIPTSFVFANGGVVVVQAPDTLFLRDRDGDGRADERRVLFTGWGTQDTHAGPSNLRYGFDNWIWGTVGYSGFEGMVGGKAVKFGMGFFRFRPDGSVLEFIRSSNNNTWGLGLSEENLVFGSTANGNASMYMPVANRYYEAVAGWSASRLESIADSQNFYPITERVRQVDWHGRYTAGSGSALYTARSFPSEYWNRVQLVAEPTGHLLGKFHLEARGADYVAYNGRNFLASDDEWTSPVVAEVGPDGALWVVDWYNYIIQHNPTPQGFKTGAGNAYETPLRDKVHGRIYRVKWEGGKASVAPDLRRRGTARRVAALRSDNLLWRMHGQRLLVEQGGKGAVRGLVRLVQDRSVDATGQNPAALHALWTLHGLGVVPDEAIEAGTKHPAAAVRRGALMVLPAAEAARGRVLTAGLLEDADAQVRLAALLALADQPPADAAGAAVYAMVQRNENRDDRWILHGATAAGARHAEGYLKAALNGGRATGVTSGAEETLRVVAGHHAQRGTKESLLAILGGLKRAPAAVSGAILDGLASKWPAGREMALTDADRQALREVMAGLRPEGRERLLVLSQRWGQGELFQSEVPQILAGLRGEVESASVPDELRVLAARRWVGLADEPATVAAVLAPVTPLATPALSGGLIQAVGESRRPEAAAAVLAKWNDFTPASRRAAVAVLSRRSEWSLALLDAVEQGRLQRSDLAAEQWGQLRQSRNAAIAERAAKLSAAASAVSADRQEVVARLLPLARERGDAARGKEVFIANCANCHLFHGSGGRIGPDLTGIAARAREDILTEVLDPNRSVEANYRLWNLTTKSGETLAGRLETETQTAVELLDVNGVKHVVQRKEVGTLEASQLSIMPTGFEALPAEDLRALVEYLAARHD